jgi:hypothetical protein
MTTTMDQLFKGYSLREIEEILLKSAIEDLKKKNKPIDFLSAKRSMRSQLRIKM